MKTINITEGQKNRLCEELALLTLKYKKDTCVRCIYFAPYKGLGPIKGNVLEVTLVRDTHNDELDKKLEHYNRRHQEHDAIRKFGVKIIIDTDDEQKYTKFDLNPSECKRSNNLMNSVILYDGDGIYTQIKEQTTRLFQTDNKTGVYFYFDNLAEILPSLDDELSRSLDGICIKRAIKTAELLTRPKKYQQVKNM